MRWPTPGAGRPGRSADQGRRLRAQQHRRQHPVRLVLQGRVSEAATTGGRLPPRSATRTPRPGAARRLSSRAFREPTSAAEIVAVGRGCRCRGIGRAGHDRQLAARLEAIPLNLDKTRYFGSECDGGYAEYTKMPSSNALPSAELESDLSDAELATFPAPIHGRGHAHAAPMWSGRHGADPRRLRRRRRRADPALPSGAAPRVIAWPQSQTSTMWWPVFGRRPAILPRSPDNLEQR